MSIVPTPLDPRGAAAGSAVARRLVGLVLERACHGELAVVDAASGTVVAGDPSSSAVVVTVRDPRAYAELLLHGSVGMGRAYVAGWWESNDLVGLCRLAVRALPAPGSAWFRAGALADRVRGDRSRGSVVDRARDREDIRAHYDLGDDFFSVFLDPTLTYSCARFDDPDATLEAAQVAKLDRICRLAGVGRGVHVLEIGTGWGSFAVHAARTYGCRVTTTTISDRQYAFARRRVRDEGLEHLVTVLDRDYRDLTGTYDALVSIEMIEAVGWRSTPAFFRACSDRLADGGRMALQAIVIDDRLYERAKRSDDFIKAMVFPGSTIPSVRSIVAEAARSGGLRPVALEDIGADYARTLARWRSALHAGAPRVAALGFDDAFVRLWDLYLAYCEAGFTEGRISDVQMALAKPGTGARVAA